MKKTLLIIGLCLFALTSFGKKVVVLEVTKQGDGWQNIFNCYNRVTTVFQGCEDGITYATLECLGAGYTWCRASRDIGGHDCASSANNGMGILGNSAILDAVNSLIESSEKMAKRGTQRGASSKKVAVVNNGKSQLYFVKAAWEYKQRDLSSARLIITIETDDNSLLETTHRI